MEGLEREAIAVVQRNYQYLQTKKSDFFEYGLVTYIKLTYNEIIKGYDV
ncbi:hypothetical protein [Bacillus daqingensis]